MLAHLISGHQCNELYLGEPGDSQIRESLEQALGLDGVEVAAPEPIDVDVLRRQCDAHLGDRPDRRVQVFGVDARRVGQPEPHRG